MTLLNTMSSSYFISVQGQLQQGALSPHLQRAHLNFDLDLTRAYPSERKYSRKPTTADKDGPRSRSNFRLTRTLKDAFEATSRTIAMDSNDGAPPPTAIDRTTSPIRRHQRSYTLPSPYAEVTSPPPAEILETYQRINDADDLADLVSEDDQDYLGNGLSRKSSGERRRRDSPGPMNTQHTQTEANLDPGFSYLDDATDDYVRGKLSTYKRDEERLSRVTSSQSPVFSRAKVGSRAEGLQRRDSDPRAEEASQDVGGEEDGLRLGLNVPKTWGNKSSSHRRWLTSITGDTPRADASGRSTARERGSRIESRSRSPRLSDKSPSRFDRKTSQEFASRSERSRLGAPPSDGLHNTSRSRSRSLGRNGLTGDSISNTPITIYKSTSRDPSQKLRSDSRELLRKLARTESPPQQSTPAQQRPEETPLPQKTPVVIGAWVDTPMTVRKRENNKDNTEEINSPSKAAPNSTTIAPKRESQTPIAEDSSKKESEDKITTKPSTQQAPSKPNVLTEKSLNIDSKKEPKPELVKPKLPKSALETFIEDAKSNGNPLSLGDDTIASLEGLMDGTDAKVSSTFAKLKEEELEKELDAKRADTTQSQSGDRYTKSLDRLGSKLQSIIHSIQDARTGLNVIEHAIVPGNGKVILPDVSEKLCETCGNAKHAHCDGRVYLAIPIPRLWKRESSTQRLRPTFLGWVMIYFGCWYLTESIMCDIYCHPTVAEVCDGYCLQPDAPQFPFVLPTMLWRWSHISSILTPIITILVAFLRLIAQLCGMWDGYVDDSQLSDIQWSSSSASYLTDPPIGGSEHQGTQNGFFGLWPGGRPKHSATRVSTSTASTSMPTILQQVIQDPQGDGVAYSIDNDEMV
ncbi:conserved hypothetical protein [Talaromyces stipitatus ATCC 10500]|uniref:Uncharacterized protein n=1 Tax=Talaromyces stipitatus (strain ATCC 10500 / CBS 375.48 / QM 6759 / NRRL 1006) TaxID=441959 RepID=B8M5L2_TALSN|nr:uncharacterized protein TSTA_031660 [Talaromyces stipitatus ATCC 10500]EED19906.1 conserved hypothetical protein [Talaromyces stipitatus ATCC 10500]